MSEAVKNSASTPFVVAHDVSVPLAEFCFYQDMPVKLAGQTVWRVEARLRPLEPLMLAAVKHFSMYHGSYELRDRKVYLSCKRMPQGPGRPLSRPGWHCDGFLTPDITYLWSDNTPTEFSRSAFDLLGGEHDSMARMEAQARPEDTFSFQDRTLVTMDSRCVHRPSMPTVNGVRTFIKLAFSRDRFDLAGNAHNYALDYSWPMRERMMERNVPQKVEP